MEEAKEDKQMREFSWSLLFIVTSISAFIFSGILKLLDGAHSPWLLRIGFLALLLTFLNFLYRYLNKSLS